MMLRNVDRATGICANAAEFVLHETPEIFLLVIDNDRLKKPGDYLLFDGPAFSEEEQRSPKLTGQGDRDVVGHGLPPFRVRTVQHMLVPVDRSRAVVWRSA